MVFTKRLREGVRRGEITCSVRIWQRPRVLVGNRYPMDDGAIEVDSIERIGLPDITPELPRESGFLGVLESAQGRKTWPRREHLLDSISLRAAAIEEKKRRPVIPGASHTASR